MATLEQALAENLKTRLDALDAAAVALGAPDAITLLQWFSSTGIRYGQVNFADSNANGLASTLGNWWRRSNRLMY